MGRYGYCSKRDAERENGLREGDEGIGNGVEMRDMDDWELPV